MTNKSNHCKKPFYSIFNKFKKVKIRPPPTLVLEAYNSEMKPFLKKFLITKKSLLYLLGELRKRYNANQNALKHLFFLFIAQLLYKF